MNDLQAAAEYWNTQLRAGKPINRVRVRRLLKLAGAERRGYTIVKKIRDTLDREGLRTTPDFEFVWIDSFVTIRLIDADGLSTANANVLSAQQGDAISHLDPGVEDQEPSDDAKPVAEPLDSPPTKESSSPLAGAEQNNDSDPVIRVSSLASANRGAAHVSMNDSIEIATTRMMFDNYSQLAVMYGVREVKGMVSWESIARRSIQSPQPKLVRDCMVDAQIISSNCSIFDALNPVEQYGYVLVRAQGKITGIVTATDIATELAAKSQEFFSIKTIEGLIRNKLRSILGPEDFDTLEDHSRAKTTKDASDLTFGENLRLLQRPDIWNRLALAVDKAQFTERLSEIRIIRNDVMHFNPDPLAPEQRKSLEQMEDFLRQLLYSARDSQS